MRGVVVFDVNETLLDMRGLLGVFERQFGDGAAMREWFGRLLQASMTVSLTGRYMDFAVLAAAVLDVLAAKHGVTVDRAEILQTLSSLPPHADAEPALRRLQGVGYRLAALTNSPPHTVNAQLTNAGLAGFFEQILSVDEVRRFKPAPEPYGMAASKLGVRPEEMWMVAAHDWDVAGAMEAGLRGVLVTRPGVHRNPAYPEPDIVAGDLAEAAAILTGRL